ncbi:TPR repeat-containing thioredoxin TTL2-like isoform X2 [Vicia villosa]|uniref:TPR repeat-containing thioredoxin TTL2-like isoform X2 n=1 Tax=Vicia villosa TaxID=3911 RepID=UPI00273B78C5|nr:TPR repeat-containing thioredoxin TTL2-like isoform X2 [Vicia villosa]
MTNRMVYPIVLEALLKLHQIDDAELILSHAPKSDPQINHSPFEAIYFGMFAEAYSFYVRTQIQIAFGRFENAVTSVEKANHIDLQNIEIAGK